MLTTQPCTDLPNYEIVIGGWGNTKSAIRLIESGPHHAEALTPGIVDNNELRGFWIRWHDKTITVGREGESDPFMSHKDPNLFPIRYVGICTAYGSSGSWIFCSKLSYIKK